MVKNKKSKGFFRKYLWIIILFLLTNTASFYYGRFLEDINAQASLEIIMPETHNDAGEFAITLSNTGDLDLDLKKVSIHSCYMDEGKWKHYYPDDLPSGKEYVIEFFEEGTANESGLIDCINSPLENWQDKRRKTITICKNFITGDLYIPQKNDSFYMCGFCTWEIEAETDKGNFSFNETMFMPINFAFEILSSTENQSFDINSPDVSCTDNFKMTYYGIRELEIEGEYDR